MPDDGDSLNPLAPIAKIVESVRRAVAPFCDPVLDELGQYVAERIRFLRFRRSVHVAKRAQEILAEAGYVPQPVDPKILVGVLEGAALESDPDLTEMWAGLLASASKEARDVLPSFPKILGELSGEEARLLDWIESHGAPLSPVFSGTGAPPNVVQIPALRDASGMTPDQYAVRMQNLDRLGLIEQHSSGGIGPQERYAGGSEYGEVGLTRLGRSLIRACKGPIQGE